MLRETGSAQAALADASFQELCRRAYRFMLLARLAEDKLASLYRAGKIHGGVFLGRGQEALSVAGAMALRPGDIYAPLIRDAAGRLAFGEPLIDLFRTYLGSRLGPMRGRDGNVHRGDPRRGYLAMISHLGAMIAVVNGALFARRYRGQTGVVGLASLGDGGTSTGAFHEGINQAAVERLPLVLVIANNQYAYSTPTSRQFACKDLADKAPGYGVEAHRVDGTDLLACLTCLHEAVSRARAGGGPQLVVAQLLRLSGHGEHDDGAYMDPRLRELPLGRDCLPLAEKQLLQRGYVTTEELHRWRSEAQQTVESTAARVQQEPAPDPLLEDWCALSCRDMAEAPHGWESLAPGAKPGALV
ncbi:MAG: thiamine pyrophosphate-dependent dehydrogenase E1 component subunit alpha [Verrucomicrobiota bacterium]|nr:thiamine pyrophosphate-dependent dehydrogenase E1 component subunit alpha [Limisphaera sp.]MDW8380925.1 thiamine pyrophosphate-dependent dehydrogenase E1 component subunit alpha [Verrucomicrobiota bacterium]